MKTLEKGLPLAGFTTGVMAAGSISIGCPLMYGAVVITFFSYDGLSTPKLLCSSGPTNGRPHRAANGEGFAFARFPFSWANLRNGPEPSRARGFCAAKRTLDGEDRSGTWGRRESGLGVQGVSPWRGAGQRPAYLTARFWRGIKNAVRPIRPPPPTRSSENPRTPTCSSACDR